LVQKVEMGLNPAFKLPPVALHAPANDIVGRHGDQGHVDL
jgi:hypothetical protein